MANSSNREYDEVFCPSEIGISYRSTKSFTLHSQHTKIGRNAVNIIVAEEVHDFSVQI